MENRGSNCVCCHDHAHKASIRPAGRWAFSIIFIVMSLVILKPFLFSQIFKRACAYVTYPIYDEAIRQYKKAVLLDRQSDEAWDWLGYAYKSKGDLRKAIETYEEAIEINPNNRQARFSLGMIYAMNKDFDKAAGHFKYIAAMGKESEGRASIYLISYHRSSCEMLMTCFERLGRTADLRHAIDMTLKFYPDNKKAKDKLLKTEGI